MRGVMLLAALLTITGCKREPSFDERYNMAANNIDQRAAAIDRQLDSATAPPPANENAAR